MMYFNSIDIYLLIKVLLGLLLFSVLITIFLCYKRNREHLQFIETNNLTGLYNLQAFCSHLEESLKADKQNHLLVFTDIEKFKVYNDSVGSKGGDLLLAHIGKALHDKEVSNLVLAAYVGADNFILCLNENNFDVQKLVKEFAEILAKFDDNYQFGFKLGLYQLKENDNIREACLKSEIALNTIKNSREKYCYFKESMYEEQISEQELQTEVKKALGNGEFIPYFQVQVDYKSKAIIGAEALIRWAHPTKGLIGPGQFIPSLEKNGYIYEIDKYLWNLVAFKIDKWKNAGYHLPPISLNVSRIDIYHEDFVETFDKIVKRNHLTPADLRIEITESVYIQNPAVLVDTLNRLKKLGYYLEMDDFGSGYSSLNTLKDLTFDMVKLDMNFMHSSVNVGKGGSILSSVVRLAQQINMVVLAEGVETKDQAEFLKSIGCYYMQGYYFSKPIDEKAFLTYLREHELNTNQEVLFENNFEEATDFLDDRTQSALLFNSFVGGAFILEYSENNLSAIRTNDLFYKEMKVSRELWDSLRNDFHLVFADEQFQAFTTMLEKAINTKGDEDVNVYTTAFDDSGKKTWCHFRSRYLSRKVDTYLFYCFVENITTLIESEQQVALSEAEYKAAVRQSSNIICRYSSKDKLLVATEDQDVEFIASSPDSLVEEGLIAFSSIDTWLKIFNDIEEGKPSGIYEEVEINNKWYKVTFTNVSNENSDEELAIIAFNDISEERRVRRNKALQYGAVIKALSGIYSICISCNPTNNSYELLDGSSFIAKYCGNEGNYDDLIALFVKMTSFKEDQEKLKAAFARENIIKAYQNGQKIIKVEHRAVDVKNIVHYTETTGLLIDDDSSKDYVYLLLSKTIDEQKRTEEILKNNLEQATKELSISQQEAIIANSMASLGCFICYYDVQKRTLILPEEYAKSTGLPSYAENFPYSDEVTLARLVNQADLTTYKKFYEDIHNGVKGGSMEIEMLTITGQRYWEKDSFNTIFDENGKPIKTVISVEDTTLQHQENYNAQKRYERLQNLLTTAFESNIEYLGLINTEDETLELYITKGDYVTNDNLADYAKDSMEVAKQVVAKERSAFLNSMSLKHVIEVMNVEGKYSFQFNLLSGLREANFYYNGNNQSELIFIVSNIQKDYENQQGILTQNFVKEEIRKFEKEQNTMLAIDTLLKALGEYTYADRAFFFSEYEGEKINNEWVKEGVISIVDSLKKATFANYELDFSANEDSYYIKDVNELRNQPYYQDLLASGIHSFITFPLKVNNEPLAIIGIDNPDSAKVEQIRNSFFVLTRTISERFIYERQAKNKERMKFVKASAVDALSSIYQYSFQLDLNKQQFEAINDDDFSLTIARVGSNLLESITNFVNKYCKQEFKASLTEFLQPQRIKQELTKEKNQYHLYQNEKGSWMRLVLTVSSTNKDGSVATCIMGLQTVDESTVKKQKDLLESDKNNIIYSAISSGVWHMNFDENGQMIEVNWSKGFRALLGFKETDEFPNTLDSWTNRLHPYDKDKVVASFYKSIENDEKYDVKYRLLKKDGDYHWFRAAGRISRRKDKTPIVFAGALIDIDEEMSIELEKEVLKQKQNMVFENAGMGTWRIEFNKDESPKMFADKTTKRIAGVDENITPTAFYKAFIDGLEEKEATKILEDIKKIKNGEYDERVLTWKHPMRGPLYVRCGSTLNNELGNIEVVGFFQIVNDQIAKEKRMLEQLEDTVEKYRQADYDKRRDFLTGLYNRLDMFEMLKDVEASGSKIKAMYMMNIDNYKKYNDLYGHVKGDECLQRIGKALNDYSVGRKLRFYRYGGEEMLGISLNNSEDSDQVAKELVELIYDLNIEREDTTWKRVTISLGYTTDNNNHEDMVNQADSAMYKAKDTGKNRYVKYEN